MEKLTYEQRLKIPIFGNDDFDFFTQMGFHLAHGYNRIVIGGRGPYVEFETFHMQSENISIPE